MRVLTVVGARPQFVKASVVSKALRARHEEILVHTGQHHDDALSDVFFRDLGIPRPDVRLDVGDAEGGQRLAAMVRGIADAATSRRPDLVLVYGDTDSTLAGALAARETGVRVAHVEAGLRSSNLRMPEEINRVAVDHLADLLLCPTSGAAGALRRERARGRVEVVGDVMLDACLAVADAARRLDAPARHGVAPRAYFVATVHRAENTDDPARLASIVAALDSLERPVLLPCHPRTALALTRAGLASNPTSLRLLPPLPYAEMTGLVADARAVLTDSGGLQKEAYFLGVPCVTLRDETEWTETVVAGWNRLAGADAARIREAVAAARAPNVPPDLAAFGGGEAARRVVEAIEAASA
jgi:UDP-N-acetylglucosamine 2-epimerase